MNTRALAYGGILTGLSVVLLYLASFMQIASWALTMLVGFVPAVFFLRGQPRAGVVQYLASALVGLMILPNKEIAVLYAFLFGLYTVLKFFLERHFGRVFAWVGKLIFGQLWVFAVWKLVQIGFLPPLPSESLVMRLILVAAGVLFVLYYDFCLSRIFPALGEFVKRMKM